MIGIGGGSAPRAAVWYMDQKIAEYVGRKKGMLASRTHVKVEESSGDEEQPEQKRPKKEVVECKGKGKAAAPAAGGSLDTDALVARLTDVVSHAANEACRQAVTGVMKPKGMEAKLTRVEADNKIVQMKGVEQSQVADYVELSDKYTHSASRVAQLTAENERLRRERDTARAAKADTEVERLWALVDACTAGSESQSESPRTPRVIPSPSKAGEQ